MSKVRKSELLMWPEVEICDTSLRLSTSEAILVLSRRPLQYRFAMFRCPLISLVLMSRRPHRCMFLTFSEPIWVARHIAHPQIGRTERSNHIQRIRKPHKHNPTTYYELMNAKATTCLAMCVTLTTHPGSWWWWWWWLC